MTMLATSTSSEETVRALQRALYRKAKQHTAFRFYTLYDKICRMDLLQRAYDLVKGSRGGPGLDGETFAEIEEKTGKEVYLQTFQETLCSKNCEASPIKRVEIPKPNGDTRPLGRRLSLPSEY